MCHFHPARECTRGKTLSTLGEWSDLRQHSVAKTVLHERMGHFTEKYTPTTSLHQRTPPNCDALAWRQMQARRVIRQVSILYLKPILNVQFIIHYRNM